MLAIVVTVVGLVDVEGVVAELDTLVGDVLVIVEVKLEEEAVDAVAVLELAAEVETIVVKLAKLVEIELVD